jgi:von Willebrand factor type A domain
MYKRNREINVFNMSALDLFASALGAFILLTLIFLPYYLKTDENLIKQLQQLKQQLFNQQKQLDDQDKKLARQDEQLDAQKKQLEKQEKEMDSLHKELDNSVQMALLGITTRAKSFVILIDMSGSMKQYSQIMQKTVERLMQSFQADISVQLIGYQGGGSQGDELILHNWQSPYRLASVTGQNRSSALRFITQLTQQFFGGTPTHRGLLEALKYDTEAIILLTDGEPNNPDAKQIVDDVTRRNAGQKEIHTVALGDYRHDPKLVAFLEALSKQNEGGFVGVAN